MLKKLVVSAVVVLFVAAYVGAQQADAPKKPAEVTVVGTVQKTVDADGKLTAVQVAAEKAPYDVVLDDNGTKLAELAGKKAQVKGSVEEKDGKKILTVASFKEVAAAPAK